MTAGMAILPARRLKMRSRYLECSRLRLVMMHVGSDQSIRHHWRFADRSGGDSANATRRIMIASALNTGQTYRRGQETEVKEKELISPASSP